jgi:hypothetical protein
MQRIKLLIISLPFLVLGLVFVSSETIWQFFTQGTEVHADVPLDPCGGNCSPQGQGMQGGA